MYTKDWLVSEEYTSEQKREDDDRSHAWSQRQDDPTYLSPNCSPYIHSLYTCIKM